jgi:hypothetical protein
MKTDQLMMNETGQEAVQVPAKPSLLETLEAIERDSRRDPEQFLDESTVPHGGE